MTKVLIVDDDAEVGLLLKAKLERAERAQPFQVMFASNGESAIQIAEDDQPDIIICDIDMPEMDGPAVAAALAEKEATKTIPLVYLSSLVTPRDVARGVKAGGKLMISKQSPVEELVRTIDDAMFKARK